MRLLAIPLLALAACASPPRVPAPGTGYVDSVPLTGLIEGTSVAAPANDIPEARRLEWFEANRPKAVHVPREIVEVEESELARSYGHRGWWDGCGYWGIPLSLSIGGSWGRWNRHRGWGIGLGWRDGWCW